MTNYEKLLEVAKKNNLIVREKHLRANKGRIKGARIAIRKRMTQAEKACVLAEELGHYYTTVGDILDQSTTENRKQEYRARAWGYRNTIDLTDIVSAYKYGCRNRYELAEYLNITEDFLLGVIDDFKARYGLFTKVDNYVVYFDPLGVLELNL